MMINDKDLARISSKIEVPVIIADILDGKEVLDDEAHYALHDMISDMQPDTALLAIALSAKSVARVYAGTSPGIQVMDIECTKLIEDYAPLWLAHAQGQKIDENDLHDCLYHAPEDLESLGEMLETAASFLQARDESAAAICKILYMQARAQALVAETFSDVLGDSLKSSEDVAEDIAATEAASRSGLAEIIPFPGRVEC